ncbi:MAG: hypothetical protein SGPRY_001667 [Prymnesium sp.]
MSGHVQKRSFSDGKRFIYQNLSQRISSVNIDIFHRLSTDEADLTTSADVPLSASTLDRWVDLNCTKHFNDFRRELGPMLLSLPLILHKRELIFEAVRRHLLAAPSIALKPMLEVTAALAADLRHEFYSEFKPLLSTLASLLVPSDVEQLEDVFSTLCYLFNVHSFSRRPLQPSLPSPEKGCPHRLRYLLKQLLADLPAAFDCYRPLLAHDRPHVREFAAESFAYLLRRLATAQLPAAVGHIMSQHAGRHGPALDEGIANLFFFVTRGLDHRFHSRTTAFVRAMLSTAAPVDCAGGARRVGQVRARVHVLSMALRMMAEQTRRQHASDVWEPLLHTFENVVEQWRSHLSSAPHRLAAIEEAGGEENKRTHDSPQDSSQRAESAHTPHKVLSKSSSTPQPFRSSARLLARAAAVAPVEPALATPEECTTEDSTTESTARAAVKPTVELQVEALSRLMVEWVGYRRGQRVPEGGRSALLEALSPALQPSCLEIARGSTHTLWAVLQVMVAALHARGQPMEDQALKTSARPIIECVVAHTPSPASPNAVDAVASSQASPWLAAHFAIALLGWNGWQQTVLSPLLASCEARVGLQPSEVLSALLIVATTEEEIEFELPEASLGMLCRTLEMPESSQSALASNTWSAMMVLSHVAPSSLAPCAPRLCESLSALMVCNHSKPAGWRAGVLTAAVNLQARLLAGQENAALPRETAKKCVLHSLRSLCAQMQAARGPIHSLLKATTQMLGSLPADVADEMAQEGALAQERDGLLSLVLLSLSQDASLPRRSALELLQRLSKIGWLPDAPHPASNSDLDRLEQRLDQAKAGKREGKSPAVHGTALDEMLSLGLAIEDAPSEPNSKQLIVDVEMLLAVARRQPTPPFTTRLLCHLTLGMYRIKFSRLWPLLRPLLQQLGQQTPTIFWPILRECLLLALSSTANAGAADSEEAPADEMALSSAIEKAGEAKASSVVELPVGLEDVKRERWGNALTGPSRGTQPHHLVSLLLEALATSALLPLAVEHSSELMSMWERVLGEAVGDREEEMSHDEGGKGEHAADGHEELAVSAKRSKGDRVASRALLLPWLKLWGAMEDLSRVEGAARLYTQCSELLGHHEPRVQAAALDCLVRWGQPVLLHHKERLHSLISDKSFRESLALFSLEASEDGGSLPTSHRPLLLPLLTRLLFAKLTQRSGRGSSKNHQSQRRATIFAFFAGFEPAEMRPLVDLLLAPLAAVGAARASGAAEGGEAASLARVSPSKQLGVVRALLECLLQVGSKLLPYVGEILSCTLRLLAYATHCACRADGCDHEEAALLPPQAQLDDTVPVVMWLSQPVAWRDFVHMLSRDLQASLRSRGRPACLSLTAVLQAREARLWCVKLLTQLLLTFPEHDFSPLAPAFFSCLQPMLVRLSSHYTQSAPGVLTLLQVIVQQSSTLPLLNLSPLSPLPCAYAMLAARAVAPAVVDVVLSLVEALLDHIDQGKSELTSHPTPEEEIADVESNISNKQSQTASGRDGEGEGEAYRQQVTAGAERLLHEHMPALLSHLHSRLKCKFSGDASKALAAAGGGEAATRELKLFTRLSSHVSSAEQAEPLLELFLPFLKLKSTPRTERVKEQVLRLLDGLLAVVRQPELHLRFLGVQYGTLRSRGAREAHCRLFVSLSQLPHISELAHLAGLQQVASLLARLNAYELEQLDELDYDERLAAYSEMEALLPHVLPPIALPLLCQCIHDVELDDIALKHAASHAVGVISSHAASQPEASGWSSLLSQVLMPALRRGLRLPTHKDSLRTELLRVLADTLLKLPSLQPELAALLSPNQPETDFFYNLTHVQMPRRQRAISRLASRVQMSEFSPATLAHYLLPILRHVVLRVEAREVDVAEEAVHTLRHVAAQLGWRPYLSALQGFARQLRREPSLERRLVRAMVAFLDGFHFDLVVPEPVAESADCLGAKGEEGTEREGNGEEVGEGEGEEVGEGERGGEAPLLLVGEEGDEGTSDEGESREERANGRGGSSVSASLSPEEKQKHAAAVMSAVRGKLLPELYSHLKDPKTEGVRVPVAIAVLKLLLLLPPSIMMAELRGFLIRVVGTLSSRDKKQREVGRETLGKVVLELGAANFGAVLHELRTSLTKGYQIHVLGYTLHYLLSKLTPTLQPGQLDYCMKPLVETLLADLFGEAAEKKEVDAIAASMKEARATKSFSSFELIASIVTFAPSEEGPGVNALLPPLHQAVLAAPGGAESLKNISTLRELLRHLSLGLSVNQSVCMPSLCVFVYGMLTTHLPPKPMPHGSSHGRGSHVPAPVGSVCQPAVADGVTAGQGQSPLSHELSTFALHLLLNSLKRGSFAQRVDASALLEPLIPLLLRAMKSDGTAVVQAALRVVAASLPYPIASLRAHATTLLSSAFAILKRTASFKGSELVGLALKVITALLRKPQPPAGSKLSDVRSLDEEAGSESGESEGGEGGEGGEEEGQPEPALRVSGGAAVSEKQLRWLLSFVAGHIDDEPLQPSLFRLLRVILGRRLVLAELYDLVLSLGEMALQAEAAAVRQACAKLYLTFLLHYPLGPKRLAQHLRFLTSNLNYPVPAGRLSLLALVKDVCARLPLPLLDEQGEAILLSLLAQLVNDTNVQCRVAVGEAIKRLLSRTCAPSGEPSCAAARSRLLKMLRGWQEDSTPQLGRAAAQLAGLAVDALGASSGCISQQLQTLIVGWCAQEATAQRLSESGMMGGERGEGREAEVEQLRWQPAYYALKALEKLCVHEPATLLGDGCEPLWSHVEALLLHEHAWLRAASGRVVGMLLAAVQPATLAQGGGSVPSYLRQQGVLLQLADASISQLHSAVISESAASQALKNLLWISNAVLSQPVLAPSACSSHLPPGREGLLLREDSSDLWDAIELCWPLVAIAVRLAPLPATHGSVRGSAAVRWYAAISMQLQGEQLSCFLPVLMPLIVRSAEDGSGKVHEAVKRIASEALQMLQRRAETSAFVATYQSIRRAQKARQRERKEREAVEAVANPELAAAKRMATNLGKRKQKKRKLERLKRGRDSGGSIGVGSRKKKRTKD